MGVLTRIADVLRKEEVLPRKEPKLEMRMYEGAEGGRLMNDFWGAATSQDSELAGSLSVLRNRSRKLVRDNPHAANLKRIVQDNIVGSGIGVQAQILNDDGTPDRELNDRIEEAWRKWTNKENCHTAGQLSFGSILRLAVGAVFQDGEVLLRKVHRPFGESRIPFALEIIESDLLLDESEGTFLTRSGNSVRFGVEVDPWMRPVAYWVKTAHPGDYQFSTVNRGPDRKRLPAGDVEHIFLIDRWPQTRGVPWMHAVLRRLNDASEYTKSELVAARASANITGFIQQSLDMLDPDDKRFKNISKYVQSEPGTFRRLLPGETFAGFSPSRPNAALDPFMRYMLRELAAGVGVSYESLSRDYSQSNYSSSRLSLLDERSLWRVLQGWIIRDYLTPIYREWLDAAVLCGEVEIDDYFSDKERYQKVRFKPRGWSWVDPAKEVQAYSEAVANGFMSRSDVIAAIGNGQDREDVDKAIKDDIDRAAELGLAFKHGNGSSAELAEVAGDDPPPGAVNNVGQKAG